MDDRRKFPRVSAPVFCRPIGKPLFGRRRATDVSLGGMRLYADESSEIGDRLELELFVSEDKTAICQVEVVWVDRLPAGSPAVFDIGVKFVTVSSEVRGLLAQILRDEG